MKTIRLAILIVFSISVLSFRPAFSADSDLISKGLCYKIEQSVNAIVDYTTTKCFPGQGEIPGSIGFVIISEKPVFSVEDSKKAWLMVVVAAVGKVMRENPTIKGDVILVSDMNLTTTKRRCFSFPVNLSKELQKKVYDGTIDLDDYYDKISASLKQKDYKR